MGRKRKEETVEQLNDTVVENAEKLNVSDSDTVEEGCEVVFDNNDIQHEITNNDDECVTFDHFDILSSQIIEILNRTPSTDYCFMQAKKQIIELLENY